MNIKKILLVLVFITLSALFPIIIYSNIKEPIGLETLLPLATVLLVSIMVVNILNKKEPQYMRLFFWVFIYVMFGIAPIAQLVYGFYWYMPKINAYSTDRLVYCYAIIWIGIAAYEIGYFFQQKRQKKRNRFLKTAKTKTGTDFFFVFFILIIAGATNLYLASLSSIEFFVFKNVSSRQGLEEFGTVVYAFKNLFSSRLPLYAILLGINDIKNNRFDPLFRIIYSICILFLFILLMLWSTTSRWWLGTISISLLLFFLGKKKFTPILLSIAIPFIYIFAFYYLAIFRSDYHFRSILGSEFSIVRNLVHGDFDSLQQLINSLIYVKFRGITYGRQLLGAIGFWFPRSLWTNKPLNTGEFIGRYFGYSYLNLSAPLWAEGFINFGIPGTIVFLLVWGYFSGKLDFSFGYPISGKVYIDWKNIVLFVLAGNQHLLLRGSLLVSSLFIFPAIIIINLWFYLKQVLIRAKIHYS